MLHKLHHAVVLIRRTAALYEIRSAFPPRKYDDPNETLRAAGLTPNGTLFLKLV
jgi:hypothetical protein